ncbi:hypothetical protein NKG94_32065 [Micromonospora sp. M12]
MLICEVGGDPEGFRRGRLLSKIGLHANDTAELFFDEFRVPAVNLLGGAEGWASSSSCSNFRRSGWSSAWARSPPWNGRSS